MAASIIYAKVLGLYLTILGVCMLVSCKSIKQRIGAIKANSEATLIIGFFELLIGLFIVVTHNIWVSGWQVIITIFGWMMVVEAITAIINPAGLVSCYKKCTEGKGFCIMSAVALFFGLLLIVAAFYNFRFCIQL